MKKQLLLIAAFLGLATGVSEKAKGQANNVLGARFIVDAPSSIAGTKDFTYSSDPQVTGPWGRALDSTWYHVPVTKPFDTQDTILCNGSTPNTYDGKWVLVFRGNCYFSDKAYHAQQAGAKGIIIVNNIPGADPIFMGAGNSGSSITIPVLMVSNYDGLAMDAALNAGDSLFVSLTPWGFGFSNDLSLVPHSMPFPHGGAIPASQLDSANTPNAYNMYTGGIVANVGVNDASNVVVHSTIDWLPNGTNPTQVHSDSAVIGAINSIDSLGVSYSLNVFKPMVNSGTSTGLYNINYYVTSDNADENATDDSASFSMYVTDSIFCKSRWDNVKGQPKSSGAVRVNNASMSWGPLFYIKNGGLTASKFQFSVDDFDTSKHDLSYMAGTPVYVYMFKWNDADGDHKITATELELQGVGSKDFDSNDSNGKVITTRMYDISGTLGTSSKVDSNSWYWFALDMGTLALGYDNNSNYYGREISALQQGLREYSSPIAADIMDNVRSGSVPVAMIPFAGTDSVENVGFRTFDDLTAAAAFHVYTQPGAVSVNKVTGSHTQFSLYPNPATDIINVKLSLAAKSDVEVNIVNAIGTSVFRDKRANVQNSTLTYSTASFAAGQYYMVINTQDGPSVRPFTVLAK